MCAWLRFRLQGLRVSHERQHLFQRRLVVHDLDVVPHSLDEFSEDDRPRLRVRKKSERLPDFVRVVVDGLPHILARIPQPLQFHDGVGGKVRLQADERRVVVQAQAVDLPGKDVLVEFSAKLRHLHAGSVIQYLRHEAVAALSGGVSADDIRHTRLRLAVDADAAGLVVRPADRRQLHAVVVKFKNARALRRPDGLQPCCHSLAVEDRLAGHAPHSQAVDLVVILVRLLEALQRPDGRVVQKAVILVGGFMHPRPWVFSVEEPFLQPVLDADRVEGEDDLLILPCPAAQSDVQLVEISLQQFARFFNPDARDVVDRLQLLDVVQACEDDLAAVAE